MENRFWNREVECAPLVELAARMEAQLATTDLFLRAARSPLYRERWRAAGIEPAAIHSYADLQRVPYTGPAELRAVQEPALRGDPAACSLDDFVCSAERPRLWVSTSGSTGSPKWIPVANADLELTRQVGFRIAYFSDELARPDDVAFGVTAPAPFISDTTLWPGLLNELRRDGPQDVPPTEYVIFSFESAVEGVAMGLKRRATIFAAFPSLAMRIAEGLTETAPQVAERQLRARFTPVNLLAYLITRVRKVRARDILHVHTGVFAGEPLDPYRKALDEAWGLKKSYNFYTFSEYQLGLYECEAQAGLHVWVDVSLPEIISQADLEREREEPGFVPPARPLWQATAGDEGELVMTHFGDAFPLVRWRTADLIRVVGVDRCRCGRTSPRVQILQRADDLVNLGIIRFSVFALQERLDAISRPAAVARWQLRVGRVGYKPSLTVLVRPAATVDEGAMLAAVREAVDQVDVLRAGWQNGLVCEPVVRLVPDLGDRQSSSGKFRPLVYEVNT